MSISQSDDGGNLNGGSSKLNRLKKCLLANDSNGAIHRSEARSALCSGKDMRTNSPFITAAKSMRDDKGDKVFSLDATSEKCDLESALKNYQEDSVKLGKQLLTLKKELEAEVSSKRVMEEKLSILESIVSTQRKEILLLQRKVQSGVSELSEKRLESALREIAFLKSKLGGVGETENSSQGDVVLQLQSNLNKLAAEKDELLNCVRKQSMLLDVLERQKLHLEAAILIDISEKELERYFDVARS
ncbi:hypothetical protein TCDM_03724 [Trypanosoma cruzi Dm28c]|uniref:Uncharacterized protein n=2 Tax=Trypanosoma cruzi TaxID=5693 RepID=V5BSD9_TRYCR|nr:hypothetical protein TCDM_03724 [Trypanosoma cruzi Dm28c]PBJ80483.1 hypothetical protein BCY84_01297 [Trypanosoma cruzi cruzi]PWU94314.1 hypothetical protein C4B63_27g159 [Trypanosoma cruzi]